jgi:FdhE protein
VGSYEFLKAWREQQFTVASPDVSVNEEALENALQAGEPLITLVPPVIPADGFASALAVVAGLLAEHQDDEAAAARAAAVKTAIQKAGSAEREVLVHAVLGGDGLDQWAAARSLPSELLTTLASLAIQPFMARHAAALAEAAPLSLWRQNVCPVCGSGADVCRIDPDNMRHLHCPTCDTQWEHHRLSCPTCNTDDVKKVNLLTLEDLKPWRVEVCDACGGYIKTLDQRHGGLLARPKVDLFLEDARTLQLDVLAEEQGYRRGGRVQ